LRWWLIRSRCAISFDQRGGALARSRFQFPANAAMALKIYFGFFAASM
jgi:hypothetical protein